MSEEIFRYEVIYRDMLQKISNGTYPKGTRLPSEKEISETYHVSRITSKRAMDMLAEQKLVSRTPGRGTFVLDRPIDQPAAAAADTYARHSRFSLSSALPAPQQSGGNFCLVGVIIDNFSAGFGELLLKSIERECRLQGYGMLLRFTYGNPEEEERAIQSFIELGVQGLIIMCVQNETYSKTLLKMALEQFPVILVDRKMKGISIPCITTDNDRGARELTRILIDKGHKKLCFLTHTSMGTSTITDRYEGFVGCIMDYPDTLGRVAKVTGYQPTMQKTISQSGSYEVEEFLDIVKTYPECTGYLALESRLAEKLSEAISILGEEKDIVCFDTVKTNPHIIAYLQQNEEQMGILAVQKLSERMQGLEFEDTYYVPYEICML